MMEQQEAARERQLAEAKARQARQAADAAGRPEFKKWIDDDIIERNARSALLPVSGSWSASVGRSTYQHTTGAMHHRNATIICDVTG